MSFNEERGCLMKITICIYLLLLVIFTSLSILFSNKIFLELLPIIILVISIEHVRDYACIYEKYFKQNYSLFKLYLNVSTIPTILFAICCEALLRVYFNSSIILKYLKILT
ncbi:hypothetical protein EDC42_0645 [Methanobrevibacter gottschalkii DSM 11977]|uniref:Phosphatidate cytidylyltransferase n=1 Tax=Methanobrevibacter gottschalkii DSM 11977 TaxID=1122229 RepID=A0A3N5B703_9EURY|nr:hypothetical protein EDC42_0645 [Methanobrevibacter gottschalkii DSM 11977]